MTELVFPVFFRQDFSVATGDNIESLCLKIITLEESVGPYGGKDGSIIDSSGRRFDILKWTPISGEGIFQRILRHLRIGFARISNPVLINEEQLTLEKFVAFIVDGVTAYAKAVGDDVYIDELLGNLKTVTSIGEALAAIPEPI
jgi:hypothetical protein